MIKEYTGRSSRPDEISEVVGSDGYYMRHYPEGLREICLGPHTKDLVGVSRFYPMLEPIIDSEGNVVMEGGKPKHKTPVVVDFEPHPTQGRFFLEEKQKFFMERNIIYVPVFLTEVLTKEEFQARFEAKTQELIQGFREELEDQSMSSVEIPMFSNESIMAEVEALALERVKSLGLRGAAKNKRLRREKEIILREKMNVLDASRRAGAIPASAR